MSMTAFEVFGVLKLDKSDYDKGLKDAEKNTSSIFGTGISKAAQIGLGAITAATTAVVGFGATAVRTGSQFDAAMGGVAATMGKTTGDLEKDVGEVDTSFGHFSGTLRDFAIYMGENTTFSATQAANALNYMALAGYNTEESMNMLPTVLDMAAAGGMELAKASDMITDTQSALGLSFDRTGQMVDEFAKAASTGNTSVEQLGEAFLRVGGLASELNGGMVTLADGTQKPTDGVQELEIALTAMANAGIKGSEAGTHMRNMLLKLSSPTKDGTKALESMGVKVYDAEGNMRSLSDVFGDLSTKMGEMSQADRIKTISDLFNTRDIASAEALLAAVGSDWDEIGASILEADGAAAQMAETKLDNLQGDTIRFQSALEAVQIAMNDKLSPTLREFVQFGTEGLQTLKEGFDEGGLQGAIGSLGQIIADGIAKIVEVLPDAVSAGAQLVGSLIEGLIKAAPQIGASALELLDRLWTGITTGLPKLTEKAVEIIKSLADGIRQNLPEMIATGLEALMEFSGSLRENIGTIIDSGIDLIMALAEGIIDGLPDMIKTLPTIISNIVGIINDNLPKILAMGIKLIVELAKGIVQAIPTLIKEFPKIIKAIIDVWQAVNWLNVGKSVITAIKKGIEALKATLPNLLKKIGNDAVQYFKGINWLALGKHAITVIVKGVKALAKQIPNALKTIGKAAVTTFKAIDWVSLGKNIILGIINGITALAGKLKDAVTTAAKNAFDAAKDFLGISSPSKKFMWIGQMVDEGFAGGIDKNMGLVENAVDGFSDLYPDDIMTKAVDISGANTGSTSISGSPVTINVYGAEGQDINELANIISKKLGNEVKRSQVVWA